MPAVAMAPNGRDICRAGTEKVTFAPELLQTRQRIANGEQLTIVALGSSTTAGSGASSRDASYPAVLEAELKHRFPGRTVTVINKGIGGQRAKDMYERIEDDVLAFKPHIVIWQTAVNDAIHDVGTDILAKYLRKGIDKLREGGAEVVLMGGQWLPRPERYPRYSEYRNVMREVAAELNVPLFKRYDTMTAWAKAGHMTQEEILGVDGLHMVDASYRCLAVLVADGIAKALLPPPAPVQVDIAPANATVMRRP